MANRTSIISALEIIKGKKIYNVDFENGTFECGGSVFSFELTKSGLIKRNSVKFLRAINEFKTDSKMLHRSSAGNVIPNQKRKVLIEIKYTK